MKKTKKKVNARLRTGSRPCGRGESPSTPWKEDRKRSFADGSRYPQEKRISRRQHNRDWMISVQHFCLPSSSSMIQVPQNHEHFHPQNMSPSSPKSSQRKNPILGTYLQPQLRVQSLDSLLRWYLW
jgi:hypothetical protein